MGLLNYLEFDGENSFEYGVFISGEGTFNAPKRRARKISIPGRDGDLVLDEGSFENIQVRYPAFIVAKNKAEFKEKLEAFRSALLSKTGYVRLSDTYHKDEYRMAAYLEGLEVSPKLHNKAGNFTLVFDCKPQRFLKIGDLPISVASGDVITNPTLFNAHPLIKFNAGGNGTITINGQTIELLNAPYGVAEVPYTILKTNVSDSIATNTTYYNTGDSFTVTGAKITYTFTMSSPINSGTFPGGQDLAYVPYESSISGSRRVLTVEDYQVSDFVAGTSKTVTKTATFTTTAGGTTYTNTITLTLNYSGSGSLSVSWAITNSGISSIEQKVRNYDEFVIVADSTAYSLRGDIYIDLDIGEAYTDYNNTIMSVNNFVNLGGELPTLPPGNTTITYSNTISNFKITPRWWRV